MNMASGERDITSSWILQVLQLQTRALHVLPYTTLCDCECACSAFYERMKEVREYHRRYPYLEVAEVSTAHSLRNPRRHMASECNLALALWGRGRMST